MKDRQKVARIVLVKERQRDVRRACLARAARELQQAQRQAARLVAQAERLERELASVGTTTGVELQHRLAIIERTREAIARANEVVQARRTIHAQRLSEVSETAREIAALDRVRERLRQEHDRRLARHEQAQLDEHAHRERLA